MTSIPRTPGLSLTGTNSADTLIGSNYDDAITGLAGADWLDGGTGNDIL